MSAQKNLGRQLEHRVVAKARAAGLPAKRHYGSGLNPDEPGDGVFGWKYLTSRSGFRFEAKVRAIHVNARGEKSVTIPLDAFRQVQKQALDNNDEQGVLVVNPKGSSKPMAVVDLDWLLGLIAGREG